MNYENETWKDIIIEKNGVVFDYTGLYEVSNYGRVRNSRTGRILKPGIDSKGYQRVILYKNGKKETFSVHRLVATMFIPNIENYPVVNHKDENPRNNCVSNLEWVTVKYNINYGTCQERRSEKLKEKPRSEETKCKISKTKKGQKHSEETKQKLSEVQKIKVICLETKQVFNSIREAQIWLGKGNIAVCLRGNAKTAGGYRWMYYDEWLALAN